jgi:chromosome partitioning protein
LIPADDALDKAQEFLSGSGMSAVLLGKRIKSVDELFQYCIIDAPPQRSRAVSFSRAAFGNINENSRVTATFFAKIGY